MNRKRKILNHIDKDGHGIEIGPSHNPIAPKHKGFKVQIVDHMSREDLITKYQGHGVKVSNIEHVDFVWRGESYAELTGKRKFYDWVIASHVIEHTPDFIGFLKDCDEILKDDGVISLVVPDKRYCFDHFRPITGISKIIDSHLQKCTIHSPGTVAEYFLNVVSKNGEIAWDAYSRGACSFAHTPEDALHGMKSVVDNNVYIDVHAWCFVPHSFRLLISDLNRLGIIPLREIEFYPTDGCEFYITLGRNGSGPKESRMELLDIIDTELGCGVDLSNQLGSSITARLRSVKRLIKRCGGWLFS